MDNPPSEDRPSSDSAPAASSSSSASSANAASSSAPMLITLTIRTIENATYQIAVPRNASVLQLKERICAASETPVHQQRLIFQGRVLKDDQRLTEYGLTDGVVVHLVTRPPDAPASSANDDPPPANQTHHRAGPRPGNYVVGAISVDADSGALPDIGAAVSSMLGSLGMSGGEVFPGGPMGGGGAVIAIDSVSFGMGGPGMPFPMASGAMPSGPPPNAGPARPPNATPANATTPNAMQSAGSEANGQTGAILSENELNVYLNVNLNRAAIHLRNIDRFLAMPVGARREDLGLETLRNEPHPIEEGTHIQRLASAMSRLLDLHRRVQPLLEQLANFYTQPIAPAEGDRSSATHLVNVLSNVLYRHAAVENIIFPLIGMTIFPENGERYFDASRVPRPMLNAAQHHRHGQQRGPVNLNIHVQQHRRPQTATATNTSQPSAQPGMAPSFAAPPVFAPQQDGQNFLGPFSINMVSPPFVVPGPNMGFPGAPMPAGQGAEVPAAATDGHAPHPPNPQTSMAAPGFSSILQAQAGQPPAHQQAGPPRAPATNGQNSGQNPPQNGLFMLGQMLGALTGAAFGQGPPAPGSDRRPAPASQPQSRIPTRPATQNQRSQTSSRLGSSSSSSTSRGSSSRRTEGSSSSSGNGSAGSSSSKKNIAYNLGRIGVMMSAILRMLDQPTEDGRPRTLSDVILGNDAALPTGASSNLVSGLLRRLGNSLTVKEARTVVDGNPTPLRNIHAVLNSFIREDFLQNEPITEDSLDRVTEFLTSSLVDSVNIVEIVERSHTGSTGAVSAERIKEVTTTIIREHIRRLVYLVVAVKPGRESAWPTFARDITLWIRDVVTAWRTAFYGLFGESAEQKAEARELGHTLVRSFIRAHTPRLNDVVNRAVDTMVNVFTDNIVGTLSSSSSKKDKKKDRGDENEGASGSLEAGSSSSTTERSMNLSTMLEEAIANTGLQGSWNFRESLEQSGLASDFMEQVRRDLE